MIPPEPSKVLLSDGEEIRVELHKYDSGKNVVVVVFSHEEGLMLPSIGRSLGGVDIVNQAGRPCRHRGNAAGAWFLAGVKIN